MTQRTVSLTALVSMRVSSKAFIPVTSDFTIRSYVSSLDRPNQNPSQLPNVASTLVNEDDRAKSFQAIFKKNDLVEMLLYYPIRTRDGTVVTEFSKSVTLFSLFLRSQTILSCIYSELVYFLARIILKPNETPKDCTNSGKAIFFRALEHFHWTKSVNFTQKAHTEFLSKLSDIGNILSDSDLQKQFANHLILIMGPNFSSKVIDYIVGLLQQFPELIDVLSNINCPKECSERILAEGLDLLTNISIEHLPPICSFLISTAKFPQDQKVIVRFRELLNPCVFRSSSDDSETLLKLQVLQTIRTKVQFRKPFFDAYFNILKSAKNDPKNFVVLPFDIWLIVISNSSVSSSNAIDVFAYLSAEFTKSTLKAIHFLIESSVLLCESFFSLFLYFCSSVLGVQKHTKVCSQTISALLLSLTVSVPLQQAADVVKLLCRLLAFPDNIAVQQFALNALEDILIIRQHVFYLCSNFVVDAYECVDFLPPDLVKRYYFVITRISFSVLNDDAETVLLFNTSFDPFMKLLRKQMANPMLKYKCMSVIGSSLIVSTLLTRERKTVNEQDELNNKDLITFKWQKIRMIELKEKSQNDLKHSDNVLEEIEEEEFDELKPIGVPIDAQTQIEQLFAFVIEGTRNVLQCKALFLHEIATMIKNREPLMTTRPFRENLINDFIEVFLTEETTSQSEESSLAFALEETDKDSQSPVLAVALAPLLRSWFHRSALSTLCPTLSLVANTAAICGADLCEEFNVLLCAPILYNFEQISEPVEFVSALYFSTLWFRQIVSSFTIAKTFTMEDKIHLLRRVEHIITLQEKTESFLRTNSNFQTTAFPFKYDQKKKISLPSYSPINYSASILFSFSHNSKPLISIESATFLLEEFSKQLELPKKQLFQKSKQDSFDLVSSFFAEDNQLSIEYLLENFSKIKETVFLLCDGSSDENNDETKVNKCLVSFFSVLGNLYKRVVDSLDSSQTAAFEELILSFLFTEKTQNIALLSAAIATEIIRLVQSIFSNSMNASDRQKDTFSQLVLTFLQNEYVDASFKQLETFRIMLDALFSFSSDPVLCISKFSEDFVEPFVANSDASAISLLSKNSLQVFFDSALKRLVSHLKKQLSSNKSCEFLVSLLKDTCPLFSRIILLTKNSNCQSNELLSPCVKHGRDFVYSVNEILKQIRKDNETFATLAHTLKSAVEHFQKGSRQINWICEHLKQNKVSDALGSIPALKKEIERFIFMTKALFSKLKDFSLPIATLIQKNIDGTVVELAQKRKHKKTESIADSEIEDSHVLDSADENEVEAPNRKKREKKRRRHK